MTAQKIYFRNLNGIRFIAAYMVIVSHTESLKNTLGVTNVVDNQAIYAMGGLGVILFFVLSGFLITYLLMEEEKRTSAISIGQFYIRRVLRIWPLYFLIVFMGLFVIPYIQFFTLPHYSLNTIHNCLLFKVILYVFFLPNLVISLLGTVPYAAQTWSIGSEEQFYLIWPVILSKVKNRYAALFGVIFVYLVIQLIILPYTLKGLRHGDVVIDYWNRFSINSMATGGIAALILSNRHERILAFVYNKVVQIMIIGILVILIGKGVNIPYMNATVYSLLFALLILNLASNPKPVISLENRIFSYLGNISYGLYMFHPVAIVICVKLICTTDNPRNYILYPAVLIITASIAAVSYNYFEKWFLKLKRKYSPVASGGNEVN